MEYKVMIRLFIPEIEMEYELYIPINKTVRHVLKTVNKLVNDSTNSTYPIKNNLEMYDRRNGKKFDNNSLIRDCEINNGSELVIL